MQAKFIQRSILSFLHIFDSESQVKILDFSQTVVNAKAKKWKTNVCGCGKIFSKILSCSKDHGNEWSKGIS